MSFSDIRHSKWFDTAYKIGVGIKGIDGFIELVAGLLLAVIPNIPHRLLQDVASEASEHDGSFFRLVEHGVAHLDAELTGSIVLIVILFLLVHGIVKLVLVYCLLKRIYRAYPYALAALIILFVLQVIPLFKDPTSIGLWLFTLLDVAIIYLVWGEYLDLREKVQVSESDGAK